MANHLKALLGKNWILWKRNIVCSLCELLLPTLLIFALIGLRSAVKKEDIPQMTYVNQSPRAYGLQDIYPNLDQFQDVVVDPRNKTTRQYPLMPWMKECLMNRNERGQSFLNGEVALTPRNKYTETIADYVQDYGYVAKFFESKSEMISYVTNEGYGLDDDRPFLCFGVSFMEQGTGGKYAYALHFNTSGRPGFGEIPSTEFPRTDPIKSMNQELNARWYRSGFLSLQNWLDNLIIQDATGNDEIEVIAQTTSVTVKQHVSDEFPALMQGGFGIYIVLPLMIIYLRMTYALLYEKEKKLREGMKMMGLQNTSFYLSWVITYFIIYTIISLVASILLKTRVFPNTNWFVLFLNYWLFCIVLIFQSMFISVFFSRALFGLIVGIVWYLMKFMVITIIGSGSTVQTGQYWAASLSSHAAVSFAFDVMIKFEGEGKGVQFADLNTAVANYSVNIALIMHALNILLYSLLAIYLDQVFPNEFGQKKHPLFFLRCKQASAKVKDRGNNTSGDGEGALLENIEPVEQVYRDMEDRNEALQIKNLYKVYPSGKQAVQNLTLSMYEGQIFVLLGHNGAGKTTTISMLTGLLDITRGSARSYGLDVESQIEQVREFMGVCPQHDILFDNLTVKEHLTMFASFKGVAADLIEGEVRRLIEDVDLVEKTDYLAKNLSGGQKRKLSVAIAFCGGSKLIFLDEPTSGMDTSARRYIWEMLKNYKSQRIVVLTTHFMDEADFLADRIGIMGEGKLICCGSSVFLKNKFGVGYTLTLVKEDTNVDSEPVLQLVSKAVPESKVLSNVSAEISFQLPMQAVGKFPALFDELDTKLKTLKVLSYGISITTLEEVFLKVAQSEAGHQQVEQYKNDHEAEDAAAADVDLNQVRLVGGLALYAAHTLALLIKRARFFKRDVRALCCEIFLPCIVVLAGLGLMSIQFVFDPPTLVLDAGLYTFTPIKTMYAGDDGGVFEYFDKSLWNPVQYTAQGSNSTEQLLDIDTEYFENQNSKTELGYYFINPQTNPNQFSYYFIVNTIQQESAPVMLNAMNQALLRKTSGNSQAEIKVNCEPFPLTERLKTIENTADGFLAAFIFSIGMAFIPASVISYVVKEREVNIKHQQLVCGVSVQAYWTSNFLMDVGKHLIPAVFCALMVLAFNVKALREDDNYGATWLLFLLYGWAIVPFCYLTAFLFKQQGNALLVSFFGHLLLGALISLIVWVLRIIQSTRNAGKILGWILRIFPSFSFAYGILNMSNRTLYAAVEGYRTPKNAYDLDISGGDILMLAIEGFVYMILVFVVEALEDTGALQKLGSRESSIPYEPKQLDDDVQKEVERCATLDPKSQAVMVRDVRKVYTLDRSNHKVAVDQVSFAVGNGEVFGLLGVNGAGKTTTFKMLSGEVRPTSGSAFVAGHDVCASMADARRQMGYCPQFDALLENLTVQEHLELFTVIKGVPYNLRTGLVAAKLQEMDLLRFKNIQAGQLSGGNKRKLSVAIAMIGNPPIVFLDEPSTGMDPEARRFMWNVISRIATQRKQSSIILTTHSMEEAEALSTKIAIQVEGNLRCLGSVQHIKNKFGHGYEIELKLEHAPAELIKQMLQRAGVPAGHRLFPNDLTALLTKLDVAYLQGQIAPHGYGSMLHIDLQKQTGLSIDSLLEFVIVEGMGQNVMQFIQNELGPFDIIEHFQTFYRFRLNSNITVGKLFGQFESHKTAFKISQYSIKQASIEQIFNTFATQKLEPIAANQNGAQVQIQILPKQAAKNSNEIKQEGENN